MSEAPADYPAWLVSAQQLAKYDPKLSELIAAAELLGFHIAIHIVRNPPKDEKGESHEPTP